MQSVEAFISTLNIRDAFDCFVALSLPKNRGGLIYQLNRKDLNDEHKELLNYMKKVNDAELADLFNKSLTGDLEEFFANITKSCKDPQQLKKLFKQTSATQLKQRIFKAIAC